MLALSPDAPMRFGAIRRGIPDISQRMLTLTLRNLERDGLLARHYYAEVPPRVEYELTARGRSMLDPLAAFTGWIRDTWQDIEASRKEFDDVERSGTSFNWPLK
jgi:DNA-binding HxlR family transcriptional regulator